MRNQAEAGKDFANLNSHFDDGALRAATGVPSAELRRFAFAGKQGVTILTQSPISFFLQVWRLDKVNTHK